MFLGINVKHSLCIFVSVCPILTSKRSLTHENLMHICLSAGPYISSKKSFTREIWLDLVPTSRANLILPKICYHVSNLSLKDNHFHKYSTFHSTYFEKW